jgi:hypothetical protein
VTPTDTYKNWKTVTEADFVSLFIKTWFAYISTLRTMFPEAYNRRGDKKYLDAYKKFYKTIGYKKLIVDDNIMASIEKVYQEGRNVIVKQYPEYYLWDFYNINENFDYTFKQIPPDKSECLIVGFKMNRNRGTKWSFIVTGFVKLFGKYYGEEYNENINFKVNISDILSKSPAKIEDNPNISEQDYLSWLLGEVNYAVSHEIIEAFKEVYEAKRYGKRIMMKIHDLEKQAISAVWTVFSLNGKDESFKTVEEMSLDRNTYEVIHQRPLNYFLYHRDVEWQPLREMTASEERWYKALFETLKTNSILWFLDFVYRLRNALFHEIIDPLDEEWQIIFKNAYLVLKEIVDLNINEIGDKKN